MRLSELDPKWIPAADRRRVGISFQCPVRRTGCSRIRIFFLFAVGGGLGAPNDLAHWRPVGDSFENLSITPSIHWRDYDKDGKEIGTHWHGHVTNGEIRNAE